MARLARRAIQRLRIRTSGTIAITFIGTRKMRTLHKRFMHQDRATDVLSFRYDNESIRGEILIAPRQAQAYVKQQGIGYEQELSRYVVHGLLHWLGHEDRTPNQQRQMRAREDRLLAQCGYTNRDIFIFRVRKPGRKIETSRTQ